jgi:hypothetical protein
MSRYLHNGCLVFDNDAIKLIQSQLRESNKFTIRNTLIGGGRYAFHDVYFWSDFNNKMYHFLVDRATRRKILLLK